jgi:hypothetical protein
MKDEKIVGVTAYPYIDCYVIMVARQIDRFHVATHRNYIARYSDTKKVYNLAKRYLQLNSILCMAIIERRIKQLL